MSREPRTAADLSASIYLIQHQDLPDDQWPALPPGVTAEHVMRARQRHETVRLENRKAIAAHLGALSQAEPHDSCQVAPAQQFVCSVPDCGKPCFSSDLLCDRCKEEIDAEDDRDDTAAESRSSSLPWIITAMAIGSLITLIALKLTGVLS